MRNVLNTLFLLALTTLGGKSQTFVWEKTIPLNGQAAVEGMAFSNENGYALYCSENQPNFTGRFVLVTSEGDTILTKSYGTDFVVSKFSPIKKVNNGYVFAGTKYVGDTAFLGVIKVNTLGDTLWTKNISSGRNETVPRGGIVSTPEDSVYYILSETADINVTPGKGMYLVVHKLLKDGTLIWKKLVSPLKWTLDRDVELLLTSEKDLVVFGRRSPLGGGDYTVAYKMNNKGDTSEVTDILRDSVAYKNVYTIVGGNVIPYEDGFVMSGSYTGNNTSSYSAFIARLDKDFNVQWVRITYKSNQSYSTRVVKLPDNNLLLASPVFNQSTINLYTFSPEGSWLDSISLTSSIGKLKDMRDMLLNDDNTLMFAGQAQNKAYLAKIDLGRLVTGVEEENIVKKELILSPNPSTGVLNLKGFQFGNLEIYDTQGALLKKLKVDNPNQQINIQDLNSGTYLYRFSMEDGVRYGKIVRQ
jgi:hypothetical protein